MNTSTFLGNEELNMTLGALVKNGGWFKSAKQSNYLMSVLSGNLEEDKRFLGHRVQNDQCVEMIPGMFIAEVEGIVDWAGYGRKSKRRWGLLFIMDEFGVVQKWKMHYKYDSNGGSVPDGKAAELIFTREGQVPEYLAQSFVEMAKQKSADELNASKLVHVGEVGKRITKRLKLLGVTPIEGYYGYSYLHRFEDQDGNKLSWFGSKVIDDQYGDWKDYKFTVKEHSEYKECPVTVITRVNMVAA